jgi:hypothetical protein
MPRPIGHAATAPAERIALPAVTNARTPKRLTCTPSRFAGDLHRLTHRQTFAAGDRKLLRRDGRPDWAYGGDCRWKKSDLIQGRHRLNGGQLE